MYSMWPWVFDGHWDWWCSLHHAEGHFQYWRLLFPHDCHVTLILRQCVQVTCNPECAKIIKKYRIALLVQVSCLYLNKKIHIGSLLWLLALVLSWQGRKLLNLRTRAWLTFSFIICTIQLFLSKQNCHPLNFSISMKGWWEDDMVIREQRPRTDKAKAPIELQNILAK